MSSTDEKTGLGKTEVTAIIRRKDGSIRETRKYKFKQGKLTEKTTKEE